MSAVREAQLRTEVEILRDFGDKIRRDLRTEKAAYRRDVQRDLVRAFFRRLNRAGIALDVREPSATAIVGFCAWRKGHA